MCRFDALYGSVSSKRQILLMPTWRRWLRKIDPQYGSVIAQKPFRESEYFRFLNKLLQSEHLHKFLEAKGYNLIFYPHYRMQPHLDEFKLLSNRIIIASRSQFDVQQLLLTSSVLITDYSSVFFDFAYMKKPIIYFQTDKERFYKEHTAPGYFDFEEDGFGPVVQDVDSVIDKLSEIINNDCSPNPKHLKRMIDFFAFMDGRNCERTYKAIRDVFG